MIKLYLVSIICYFIHEKLYKQQNSNKVTNANLNIHSQKQSLAFYFECVNA